MLVWKSLWGFFGKVWIKIIVQEISRDISQTTGWVNLELSRKKKKNQLQAESLQSFFLGNITMKLQSTLESSGLSVAHCGGRIS